MTIIQLEYLLAVANYGSFSLAAEKCFVTQPPSLSMQVKNLEEELGVIVLDRSKKPVLPTDAGLAVIRQAKEAVQAFAMVREVVSDLQNEISGTLRLGVIPTIAPYLLHRFIPDFVRKCPKVELQIREMMTGDIIRALDRDMLDAAIMAGGTSPKASAKKNFSTTVSSPTCRPTTRSASAATSVSKISTCAICCYCRKGTACATR